jgi:hypothetical protein
MDSMAHVVDIVPRAVVIPLPRTKYSDPIQMKQLTVVGIVQRQLLQGCVDTLHSSYGSG